MFYTVSHFKYNNHESQDEFKERKGKRMNPANIFKIKGLLDRFNQSHPKVLPFFRVVNQRGITEGTIIEMKVKFTDEKEYVTNIKVTEDDLELFQQLKELSM